MLFNSYEFIFLFFPFVVGIYFFLRKKFSKAAQIWLILASLFFYGNGNWGSFPVFTFSIVFNLILSKFLLRFKIADDKRRITFFLGLFLNAFLLGYFKYFNFFVDNSNNFFGTNFKSRSLFLPLAISFFTFQQISFLVDIYREKIKKIDPLNYLSYVTFFPYLISGPLTRYLQFTQQFFKRENYKISYQNITQGFFVFFLGLFQKVILADWLATRVGKVFDSVVNLDFFSAWYGSLSYCFQLFFDFSGYIDMALGIALIFNVFLPLNFNSPYRAKNPQDFWRRWHITLGNFLRDYIYISLGGNRKGLARTCLNLILTFLVAGFWHGAAWTFVVWGLWHGFGLVAHRLWKNYVKLSLNNFLAWLLTFIFVNIGWVFFRAKDFAEAFNVLKAMFGFGEIILPARLEKYLNFLGDYGFSFSRFFESKENVTIFILCALVFIIFAISQYNSWRLKDLCKPTWKCLVFLLTLALICVLNINKVTDFIYSRF